MKKAIQLITVIFLFASVSLAQKAVKSSIQQQTSSSPSSYISLSAPITGAVVGTNFTIPITVSDTTGLGIIAYQFDLHYDPAVITPQATPVTAFGTLSSSMAVVYNPISPGILKVVVYGAYPLTGAGTLFNFNFTAVGQEGAVSTLTWVNPMFNEGNPGVYATNGQIRLTSQPSNPTPVAFTGRETSGGSYDSMNRLQRNNTFVMASEGQTNASSMTTAFDMIPGDEINTFKIVDGRWTIMVYENGLYVGSIYGEFFDGRVTDQVDGSGNRTMRTVTSWFRIKGGIGRFENAGSEENASGQFTSVTDYTNGKRTTATLSYIL